MEAGASERSRTTENETRNKIEKVNPINLKRNWKIGKVMQRDGEWEEKHRKQELTRKEAKRVKILLRRQKSVDRELSWPWASQQAS